MNDKNLLEMKNITKEFPGVVALNDVSISLKEGEILSIVGENGAGKSTLMKILSGEYAYETYSGEIILDGEHIKLTSNGVAEKSGIAMIYQEVSVELDLTVAENIMLGIMPKTPLGFVDWKKTRKIANEMLASLMIDLDVGLIMRPLSSSMQQFVCIARALVRKPKILILDEPTAALTESEVAHLLETLRGFKKKGISCIYISHKLDEVFRISDRLIVMRDAHVVSEYPHDKIESSRVIEDMIGRRMDTMYPLMDGRTMGNEVFRIENFTVPHPSAAKYIISNVTFSVRKGEVLGLAGLVGSGRSELIRAIFGALPKKDGEVYVEGKRCRISNPTEAIANGLGMLTEDRKKDGIVGTMNIGENMTLSIFKKIAKFTLINFSKEKESISRYFNDLKIKAPSSKTNILNLSGGNQQKVILAKLLLTDMKVLFLDEPTRGIDVGAKSEIYKIIQELSEKGISIVMVSSEYSELLAMCDRFLVIGNGRIVGELDKKDASEAAIIRMASCV